MNKSMKQQHLRLPLALLLCLALLLSAPTGLVLPVYAAEDATPTAFRYQHDPRLNPSAMADIVVDPTAVYGFAPSPDGSLKQYATYDWSDPAVVNGENGRLARIAYHESIQEMYTMLDEMTAQGKSVEEIARAVSTKRNEIRLAAYDNDPEGLATAKARNLERYGHEEGPLPDELYEQYGSWETVIEKAFSVNSGMDACLGLYDDYYALYVAAGQIKEEPLKPVSNAAAQDVRERISSGVLDVTAGDEWTICIYLCGSNLESSGSSATVDLLEMLEADIPEGVNVLVMTGGSSRWDPKEAGVQYNAECGYNAYVLPSSESTQIFAVDDEKMTLLYDYGRQMNMGDAETAAEFFEFAQAFNPDVKHMMYLFWNHGGGPLGGAEYDEIYNNAFMQTEEIGEMLSAGVAARGGKKLDIVDFDCCMMSSLEVASVLRDTADYLIVSEEIEPNNGQFYHWMSILGKFDESGNLVYNRDVTVPDVCRRIVDLYPNPESTEGNLTNDWDWQSGGDADWDMSSGLTLTVIDLNKIPALVDAMNALATDLLAALDDTEHPERYTAIARVAEKTPVMYEGTRGLLDLYGFASMLAQQESLGEMVLHAAAVVDAIGAMPAEENHTLCGPVSGGGAVVYRGVSPDYSDCGGISLIYPDVRAIWYGSADLAEEEIIAQIEKSYSGFGMSEDYVQYVARVAVQRYKLRTYEGTETLTYDNGTYTMTVDNPESIISIANVQAVMDLYVLTPDQVGAYLLGTRAVDEADWDNGQFRYSLDMYWFNIDGQLFTANLGRDQGLVKYYDIPIRIEGRDYLSMMTVGIIDTEGLNDYAYILSISDFDPQSEYANRSYRPREGDELTFSTLLLRDHAFMALYLGKLGLNEEEIQQMLGDYSAIPNYYSMVEGEDYLETATVTLGSDNVPFDADLDLFGIKLGWDYLKAGGSYAYEACFRIQDLQGNIRYSSASGVAEALVEDPWENLYVETAEPVYNYEGSPIEPALNFYYRSDLMDFPLDPSTFDQNELFDIKYVNNDRPGTGIILLYYHGEEERGEHSGLVQPVFFTITEPGSGTVTASIGAEHADQGLGFARTVTLTGDLGGKKAVVQITAKGVSSVYMADASASFDVSYAVQGAEVFVLVCDGMPNLTDLSKLEGNNSGVTIAATAQSS